MGVVYLARVAGGRRVAVKLLLPEHVRNDAFRAQFRREVRHARRVKGLCTAPVIDADVDADRPYLVTEYVDGRTLQQLVDQDGPLAAWELPGLAVSTAFALQLIHEAGVIHRDFKPGNVLLSRTGPRVIDFGIAAAVDATSGPLPDWSLEPRSTWRPSRSQAGTSANQPTSSPGPQQ
jgi:serine/threonine protein kinase